MSETTKILVVSDVHGRMRDLRWVLQNETADAMFYLGDGLYDLNGALELNKTPVPYPIYRVAGNCDVGYQEPTEGMAPFAGVLFFYTHGHHYGVKMGGICRRARCRCSAVWPHPSAGAGARCGHGGYGV